MDAGEPYEQWDHVLTSLLRYCCGGEFFSDVPKQCKHAARGAFYQINGGNKAIRAWTNGDSKVVRGLLISSGTQITLLWY